MNINSALLSFLFLGVGVVVVVAQAPATIKSTAVVKTTTTMAGQPLVYPTQKPEVVVNIAEIPPGAMTARHKHPGVRYTYVLEGALVIEMEGGMTHNYPVGTFIIESIDQWHVGKNVGSTSAKVLVVDHVTEGGSNLITQ